jgi:uncharacterized protein YecE (DUF72 family)
MTPSIGRLYVGASGFSYPSWRGGFYAPGLKADEFLRFYAERLPSVEINSTFYRLPAQATFERWAETTPAGFRFAVKMNRRILWNAGLAGAFCERVRALGDRLGPVRIVLAQKRDDAWLRLLLASLDPELRYAFDLRHASWAGVEDVLADSQAVRVGELEGSLPVRYLRFREPPYDDDALAGLAVQIRPLLAQGIEVYAYFKHEDEPTAPAYAQRLLAVA